MKKSRRILISAGVYGILIALFTRLFFGEDLVARYKTYLDDRSGIKPWEYLVATNGDGFLSYGTVLDREWKRVYSTTTGLSFEIPKDWSLYEQMSQAEDGLMVPVVQIEPSKAELVLTPKSGVDNIIKVYTRFRLEHPRPGNFIYSGDAETSSYMLPRLNKNKGLNGYKVYGHKSDQGLIGVYQKGTSTAVFEQVLCKDLVTIRCNYIFVHVMDSIEPIK